MGWDWLYFKCVFWNWVRHYIPERRRFFIVSKVTYKIPVHMSGSGINVMSLEDVARCTKKCAERLLRFAGDEHAEERYENNLMYFMQLAFMTTDNIMEME